MVRHMAKLEFLGLSVNKYHRQIIDSIGRCFKEYYMTCLQELESMAATRFYNNVSILDILIGSYKELSGYARNEELVNALDEQDYGNMGLVYFPRLAKRFHVEVEAQRLQKAAAKVLSNIFALNDPSHLVNETIICYLKTTDFKILCENVLTPV